MPKHTIRKAATSASAKSALFILLPVALISAALILFLTTQRNREQNSSPISCKTTNFSGLFLPSEKYAYIGNQRIEIPDFKDTKPSKVIANRVLGDQDSSTERWIEVDLSDQKLTAWEADKIFLETAISSGLPWTPTPQGEFRIWTKLRHTKMEGGQGKYYYYLPNVPFTMFFENKDVPAFKGYGLHGTYWHNDFGTQRSHGCVNLPTPIAEKLFHWIGPQLPEDKSVVRATTDNPGTRVIIHD